MHHSIYVLILFFLTACGSTPEIYPNTELSSENKIKNNKTLAFTAQEEYKQLQLQREKE